MPKWCVRWRSWIRRCQQFFLDASCFLYKNQNNMPATDHLWNHFHSGEKYHMNEYSFSRKWYASSVNNRSSLWNSFELKCMKERQMKLATVSASKKTYCSLFQLKFPAIALVFGNCIRTIWMISSLLGDRSDIIIILSIKLIDTQHLAAGHFEYVAEIRDVPAL